MPMVAPLVCIELRLSTPMMVGEISMLGQERSDHRQAGGGETMVRLVSYR
jgi:hypothetical protein